MMITTTRQGTWYLRRSHCWYASRWSNTWDWNKWNRPEIWLASICRCPKVRLRTVCSCPSFVSCSDEAEPEPTSSAPSLSSPEVWCIAVVAVVYHQVDHLVPFRPHPDVHKWAYVEVYMFAMAYMGRHLPAVTYTESVRKFDHHLREVEDHHHHHLPDDTVDADEVVELVVTWVTKVREDLRRPSNVAVASMSTFAVVGRVSSVATVTLTDQRVGCSWDLMMAQVVDTRWAAVAGCCWR